MKRKRKNRQTESQRNLPKVKESLIKELGNAKFLSFWRNSALYSSLLVGQYNIFLKFAVTFFCKFYFSTFFMNQVIFLLKYFYYFSKDFGVQGPPVS